MSANAELLRTAFFEEQRAKPVRPDDHTTTRALAHAVWVFRTRHGGAADNPAHEAHLDWLAAEAHMYWLKGERRLVWGTWW